jgi:hypothetical protein
MRLDAEALRDVALTVLFEGLEVPVELIGVCLAHEAERREKPLIVILSVLSVTEYLRHS